MLLAHLFTFICIPTDYWVLESAYDQHSTEAALLKDDDSVTFVK